MEVRFDPDLPQRPGTWSWQRIDHLLLVTLSVKATDVTVARAAVLPCCCVSRCDCSYRRLSQVDGSTWRIAHGDLGLYLPQSSVLLIGAPIEGFT
jgi:hypothetical protein